MTQSARGAVRPSEPPTCLLSEPSDMFTLPAFLLFTLLSEQICYLDIWIVSLLRRKPCALRLLFLSDVRYHPLMSRTREDL